MTDQAWELEVAGGAMERRALTLPLAATAPVGRQVFALRITEPDGVDARDAFVVADVGP